MSNARKLLSFSLIAAFLLAGAHVFAASQEEAAGAGEMERVSIGMMYRGWDSSAWDSDLIAQDRVWGYIEDKLNIDFRVEYGGSGDIIVASMAAGTAPDIVMMWPGHPWLGIPTWQSWINDGVLTNLNDLVSADPERYPIINTIFQDPVYRLYNLVQNGGVDNYHALMTGNRFKPITDSAIIYNGFMLDELGLEVPATYDEQINAMRMARDKLGATGFGWPTYKGTHWKGLNYLYFQTHGQEVDGYHLDENGNWYDAAVDPGNKAIWATVAEHGAEQLLYPGWLTGELFEYIDQLVAGKHLSGLYKGPRPDGYMAHFEKFQAANPGATLADFPQGLHPISGPGGRAHDDAVPLNIYRATAIPAFSDNPDRALDLLEWWVSEEGQVARWFGIKGIHFTQDDFSDFNAEEFLKDQSWNPDVAGKTLDEVLEQRPGDLMFLPGAATSNYDNGIVPFAETGSWFEAYQNLRDVRTERVNAALAVPDGVECSAPFTAIWQGGGCAACTGPNPPAWCQFQAGNELWHSFLAEGWEGWPQYVDLVALSEEETQIQAALTDIKNKWWVAFVLGNKDVEADWDSFVAEYNEAGGQMLFDAWNVKVADAKATWDSVQ
jgi:hypothetical protein